MNIDVVVIAGAASIFPEETLIVSLLDCLFELETLIPKLTTNVDVTCLGAHSKANAQGAFNKLVRVVSQDLSIFARSRL